MTLFTKGNKDRKMSKVLHSSDATFVADVLNSLRQSLTIWQPNLAVKWKLWKWILMTTKQPQCNSVCAVSQHYSCLKTVNRWPLKWVHYQKINWLHLSTKIFNWNIKNAKLLLGVFVFYRTKCGHFFSIFKMHGKSTALYFISRNRFKIPFIFSSNCAVKRNVSSLCGCSKRIE